MTELLSIEFSAFFKSLFDIWELTCIHDLNTMWLHLSCLWSFGPVQFLMLHQSHSLLWLYEVTFHLLNLPTNPYHFACLCACLLFYLWCNNLVNGTSNRPFPLQHWVNSAWPVLGIPRRTGIPLGLHSDWTGTGTNNLAAVGWWTSPSGVLVESK